MVEGGGDENGHQLTVARLLDVWGRNVVVKITNTAMNK